MQIQECRGILERNVSPCSGKVHESETLAGSMFGSLKKYKDEGFWKKNQYFTVYTESTACRYQIFSYENAVVGGNVYKVGYQPGGRIPDIY